MSQVWRLGQLSATEIREFSEELRPVKLIELGLDYLCAIPTQKPQLTKTQHTPFREELNVTFFVGSTPVSTKSRKLVRLPFMLQSFMVYAFDYVFYLFVWGGLDSDVMHYSARAYRRVTGKRLAPPESLSFKITNQTGEEAYVRSYTQDRKNTFGGRVVLWDSAVSPEPDDGGGVPDFGLIAIPDIRALLSEKSPFPTGLIVRQPDHSYFHKINAFGLWEEPSAKAGPLSPVPPIIPFSHPGDLISPRLPGQTGDQDSFGIWKGWDVTPTSALRLASYDSHRPSHWFELDGSIVRASKHPQWHCYNHRPHFSKAVSPDQLGRHRFVVRNGWENYDDQHDEQVDGSYMQAAIRMTGDPCLILEAQMAAQRYISRMTLNSNSALSDPMSGRELGRVSKSLAYLLSILPKNDKKELYSQIVKRFRKIELPWMQRTFATQGKVKYLRTISNDNRVFVDGKGWIVWEDALAVGGLYALLYICRIYGDNTLWDELEGYVKQLAFSIVDYAGKPGSYRIPAHIRILPEMADGVPSNWWDDTSKVHSDEGTDFTFWAIPAFVVASNYGNKNGAKLLDHYRYGEDHRSKIYRWMGIPRFVEVEK